MRHMVLAIVLIVFLGYLAWSQETTQIDVTSTIKAVTVFSDRAMVKRSFTQDFTKGVYKIEVKHLPGNLLDESIRVSGEGTAKAKILGVELKPVYLEQAAQLKFKEAGEKLDRLKRQIQTLNVKAEVLNQQKEFVKSIGTETAESINKDLPVARPSVAEWSQMVRFIGNNLDSLNQAIQQITDEKTDLEAKCEVARNELQLIQSERSHVEKSAFIDIATDNAGSLTLEVTYVIMGASWSPLYDIRVNSDTIEAEITYFGNITQATGEDWQNVKLTLSTATTSVKGALPELGSISLDLRSRVPAPAAEYYMNTAVVAERPVVENKMAFRGSQAGTPEQIEAQAETSLVSNIGISTTFELIQKASIQSGKTAQKVTITTLKLKGDMEHFAIPKLSENVYLKAKVKNTSESPLLAGRANVFYDGDFISATAIPTSVATESFELFLGIDQGMKIKRELVEKFTDEAGFTNSKKRVTYEFKILANNFRKTEEKLTVLDQQPISLNDDIEVNLKSIVPEPNSIAGDKEKGLLRWTFSLQPSEQKEMRFKYEIKYPQNASIDGLN